MDSNFIEITRDNLSNFISAPKLLVVFGSSGCGGCRTLKPKLKNISSLLPIAYVDIQTSPRSILLYPNTIEFLPTIAYFERGYFKTQVSFSTLWFDIEKIIKNEYL